MHTFLIFTVGLILGYKGLTWLYDFVNYLEKRAILKHVTPSEVDEKRLCKTTHSWILAPLWNEKGESKVRVCQVCGFIPEMERMASTEAIDRISENNKIREVEQRIYKDFLTQEDNDIKKYFDQELKNGVSFEKLTHVHGAGMTFNTRFSLYKQARAGDIEKELKKSDA